MCSTSRTIRIGAPLQDDARVLRRGNEGQLEVSAKRDRVEIEGEENGLRNLGSSAGVDRDSTGRGRGRYARQHQGEQNEDLYVTSE